MKDKPNVIYVLADDMGYGDVSALNENAGFKTPCLDEMCREGLAFQDAHATSALCTPSRYGILTGRYSWRSELKRSVLSGFAPALIENDIMTVGDLFHQKGYKTIAIGKWHLGMDFSTDETFKILPELEASPGVNYGGPIKNAPVTRGFDYFYGICASLDMPPYVYVENDHFTQAPNRDTAGIGKPHPAACPGFWRKGPTAPDFVHEDVLPQFTRRVLNSIEENAGNPFFLYFPLPAPHAPMLPTGKFQGASGINEYCDSVIMCDDIIGQINGKLKALGLYEDTILIFASDNGCSPVANYPQMQARGHNPSYVFRGTKADIYEGGHRIPLMVRWPRHISGGGVCKETVSLGDFMATMADILDVKLPPEAGVDSISNLPLWQESAGPAVREDLIHQSADGSLSIRKGRFKLEMCPGSGGWSYPAPGEETSDMPRFQLYDLETDIGEKINLVEQHPAIAEGLKKILAGHIRRGRSTPGSPQQNRGEAIWDTIRWLEEC
ncbi:arylsulfatase [Spirochaetia bacterium]|nr:arylsulfatase [Spirochaetia bacterium]